MTGVAVYLAVVVALAAWLCGHQGEGAAPGLRWSLRTLRHPRPTWAHGPIRARHFARRTRPEPK